MRNFFFVLFCVLFFAHLFPGDTGANTDNYLAAAKSNGKSGFVNAQGEWAIQPKFDLAGPFAVNGLAPAANEWEWGFIHVPKGE